MWSFASARLGWVTIAVWCFASRLQLLDAAATPAVCDTSGSHDFIIVGGGTAGLAVATRLTQRLPHAHVLVIEAGPDGRNVPQIFIPGYKGSTLGGVYDWNFTTVPQPNALNRVLTQGRGRVLGGSSALNLMTWDRASVPDYDAWEVLGSKGWNFNSMLPAMLKCENFIRSVFPPYGQKGVGTGGPVQSLINRFIPAQQLSYIPAMNALGVPSNLNSLGGNPLGVMYQPSNIRESNYSRSYSPEYLKIAGPNLCVIMNNTVTKILMKQETSGQWSASGVLLSNNVTINAHKEVILSAGSFQSPTLLEASGIGGNSLLASAGIKTRIDLPGVGENLQDHVRIQNSYQLKSNYSSFDELRFNASFAAEQLTRWYADQKSTYDYTGSGYAYLTWSQVSGAPTAQLLKLARQAASSEPAPINSRKLSYLTDPSFSKQVPQLEVIFSDGYTGVKGYPSANSTLYGQGFFTLIASVQHPFSRGSVHINTTVPVPALAKPVINPNYLSQPYDLLAVKTATQYLRKIANTSPLNNTWVAEYEPGSSVQSDADFDTYARNATLTIYHPVGTCAMMPRNQSGVVDATLKVYGTTNLRVVDASIMPLLLSAHLQTAVYGIAERAADFIAQEYQ